MTWHKLLMVINLSEQKFESWITIKEKLQKEVEIFNINALTSLDWQKHLVGYL